MADERKPVKTVLFVLAAAGLLLLSGCGWEGTGTVVDRSHEDSYQYQCGSIMVGNVPIPQWCTQPDIWELKVRDSAGDMHWVDVSEGQYGAVKNGGAFDNRAEN